jgi:hypothetical protein
MARWAAMETCGRAPVEQWPACCGKEVPMHPNLVDNSLIRDAFLPLDFATDEIICLNQMDWPKATLLSSLPKAA